MLGKTINEILKPYRDVMFIPDALSDVPDDKDIPFVNGCGAADSWLSVFVPQKIGGIDVRAACLIHDYRYTFGETMQDKIYADIEFLHNLCLILSHPSNHAVELSARKRQALYDKAFIFFMFVQLYGEKAYVAGKGNKSITAGEFVRKVDLDSMHLIPPDKRGSEDDEML